MVTSINGVQNRFGAGARARGAEPEFYRLGSALRRIYASGAIGMRVGRMKDQQEWAVMTLAQGKVTEQMEQDQRAVREILGLRQDLKELQMVFGSAPRGPDWIRVTEFCRGGLYTLLFTAQSPDVKAAVPWYGQIKPAKTAGIRTAVPLNLVVQIKAPVLGLYGGANQGIPVADVKEMESAPQGGRQDRRVRDLFGCAPCLSRGLPAQLP